MVADAFADMIGVSNKRSNREVKQSLLDALFGLPRDDAREMLRTANQTGCEFPKGQMVTAGFDKGLVFLWYDELDLIIEVKVSDQTEVEDDTVI